MKCKIARSGPRAIDAIPCRDQVAELLAVRGALQQQEQINRGVRDEVDADGMVRKITAIPLTSTSRVVAPLACYDAGGADAVRGKKETEIFPDVAQKRRPQLTIASANR